MLGLIDLGVAFLFFWLLNVIWVWYELIKHTPNWKETDQKEIFANFITNAPLEKIRFVSTIGNVNPWIGLSGVLFILLGFI